MTDRKEYHKRYRLENKEKIKQWYLKNSEKIKEQRKQYRLENKEKIKENKKQYRLENKEKIKENKKQYRLENLKKIKEKAKQYYLKNKEKIKEKIKQYRLENKEKLKEKRKQYYLKNKEKILKRTQQYADQRIKKDPNFKLKKRLRTRIRMALKHNSKKSTTAELLGASISVVWNHLEKQFKPGMTRENHGLWHIDHIKPCASFDLSKLEEQKKCFHYTNLQPLWAAENMSKGAKYEVE